MKFNQAINNFTAGEWSPKMYGRTDTEQYFKACRDLTNFIPVMQGGAFKRPGTRLMPAPTQTYDGTTVNMQARLDNAGECRVFIFTLSDGSENHLFITDQTPGDATGGWFIVTDFDNFGADRLRGVKTTANTNYTSSIDLLEVRQIGDLIFLVDGEGVLPPRYLQRRSDGSNHFDLKNFWEAYPTSKWICYPYTDLVALGTGPTITVSGTFTVGGTVTLTASSAYFEASMDDAFNYGTGTYFRFTGAGNTGVVEVTAYTSATVVTGTVRAALTGTGASPQTFGLATGTAWDRTAWGAERGWPRSFTGYQGRLYFGGTIPHPDTVWASAIDNVFRMMELPFAQDPGFATFADDNSRPWSFVPNSDQASQIVAMSSSKMLAILTDRCEITMFGSNGALGPNDVTMESSTYFGAENVQPERVGNFLTFVQKGGKLRDLIYSFDEYQYKSNDLAFTSDHLGRIKRMCSAEIGSSVLFVLTAEGQVRTLTLERDYQINAWARQSFGGPGDIVVFDISVLNKTEVYFLIRRTIDGTPVTTYEKLSPFYEGPTDTLELAGDQETAIWGPYTYMDSTTTVPRELLGLPASTSVTFGTTYANQEVSVFGLQYYTDNVNYTDYKGHVYLGKFTANASGVVTHASFIDYDVLTCGYAYQAQLIPMAIEQGAQYGSPVGKGRRSEDIFFRFYNSLGCTYGNERELFDMPLTDDTAPLDEAQPLNSGVQYMKFPQGVSRDYVVVIQSNVPHPLNILNISMGGLGYD